MNTRPLLHIRDARADEYAAIRALTLAAYEEYATIMAPAAWAGLSASIANALESRTAQRIVAERDGALVGSVMLFPPAADTYGTLHNGGGSVPELRMLAVAPEARGQQIGKALVQECIQRARAAGATALGLHTSDSLRVAVRMYEQMGFTRVPEEDFQADGTELVKGYQLKLGS